MTGRQKEKVYLASQQAVPASAIASVTAAKSRALAASLCWRGTSVIAAETVVAGVIILVRGALEKREREVIPKVSAG